MKRIYIIFVCMIVAAGCKTQQEVSDRSPDVPSSCTVDQVPEYVQYLSHQNYRIRQNADQALRALPISSVPELKKFQNVSDPEVEVRLKNIIAHIRVERGKPAKRVLKDDGPSRGILTREQLERMRRGEHP